METLPQVSNESFSHNWVMNIPQPPFPDTTTSIDDGFRLSLDSCYQDVCNSFIEMDPKLFSRRWKPASMDFDFGLSPSEATILVPADQIIWNGLLLPLHLVTPQQSELLANFQAAHAAVLLRSLSVDSSKSLLSRSNRFNTEPNISSPIVRGKGLSLSLSKTVVRNRKHKFALLGGCARSSRKLFHKYLLFMAPFCAKVKGLVSLTKDKSAKILSSDYIRKDSRGTSPSTNGYALSKIVDAGIEKAIDDAVLHCKNSISWS